MKPHSAKRALLERIVQSGRPFVALTPSDGVNLLTDFYREERAEGCDTDGDADMLLYQWGTYDLGGGEFFEFDLTRQLITGGEDEDIFQLSLTFRFRPAGTLRELGAGNRWCHSPDGLEEFRAFVRGSAAFLAVGHKVASDVRLDFGIAG